MNEAHLAGYMSISINRIALIQLLGVGDRPGQAKAMEWRWRWGAVGGAG